MITIHEMPPIERAELFARVLKPWEHGAKPRRDEMSARHEIATDSYDGRIKKRISDTHHDSDVVTEMSSWAVGYFNIWKRCARKIAVAYKRRPARRLEGAGKKENRKLADFYRKIGFDARALKWQRRSVIMNRIIVVALARKDEDEETIIDFEVLTGANCEVWMPPDRPATSMPDIVAQLVAHNAWDTKAPAIRVFDKASVSLWNNRGEFLSEVPHDVGTFPGADMLSEHELDEQDFWDWKTWRSATSATVEAGLIGASMGWTRKTQCRNIIALLTSSESSESTADNQNLVDHEKPLILNGQNVTLMVENLNTAVDGFLTHIKSIQDEVAEQMTGTASTFADPDPKFENAGVGGTAQHVAINEVRESQIAALERFERRMAFVLCKLGKAMGEDVPDPEKVRETFRIDWARLAFLDTPENRIKVWVEETKFGIFDQVAALVEREGISEEEAEERVMEIAERRAKLDEFRASRNQQGDPQQDPTTIADPGAPGDQLAAEQGRAGGSQAKPQVEA